MKHPTIKDIINATIDEIKGLWYKIDRLEDKDLSKFPEEKIKMLETINQKIIDEYKRELNCKIIEVKALKKSLKWYNFKIKVKLWFINFKEKVLKEK